MSDQFSSMNIPQLLDAWEDAESDAEADAIREALEGKGYRADRLVRLESLPTSGGVPAQERSPDERWVARARGLLLVLGVVGTAGLLVLILFSSMDPLVSVAGLDPLLVVTQLTVAVLVATHFVLYVTSRHAARVSLTIAFIIAAGSILIDLVMLLLPDDPAPPAETVGALVSAALRVGIAIVYARGMSAAARIERAAADAEDSPPIEVT